MEHIKWLVDLIQMLMTLATFGSMIYIFKKFLDKPHDTLENRVTTVEVQVKEIKDSLKQGNDRFREIHNKFDDQEEVNHVIFKIFLSFVNFEITYCYNSGYTDNKDLLDAKTSLEKYLSEK